MSTSTMTRRSGLSISSFRGRESNEQVRVRAAPETGERGGHREDSDVVHRVHDKEQYGVEGPVGVRGQVREEDPRGLCSVDGKPQTALS